MRCCYTMIFFLKNYIINYNSVLNVIPQLYFSLKQVHLTAKRNFWFAVYSAWHYLFTSWFMFFCSPASAKRFEESINWSSPSVGAQWLGDTDIFFKPSMQQPFILGEFGFFEAHMLDVRCHMTSLLTPIGMKKSNSVSSRRYEETKWLFVNTYINGMSVFWYVDCPWQKFHSWYWAL